MKLKILKLICLLTEEELSFYKNVKKPEIESEDSSSDHAPRKAPPQPVMFNEPRVTERNRDVHQSSPTSKNTGQHARSKQEGQTGLFLFFKV